jgi:crotonobetaine/carnitine-CoA ligase
MAACKSQLADFKRPRQVILVAEFPRSTLEKVSKLDLRKRLPQTG